MPAVDRDADQCRTRSERSEFPDDQISVYFTVRQYWGSGPELSFLESFRRQREVGEEILRRSVIPRIVRRWPRRSPRDKSIIHSARVSRPRQSDDGLRCPDAPLAQKLSTAETAFTVLALARALKAQGKDVVELEIGDSPFPSTPHAKAAGIRAIEENQTGYWPSLGLPEFRAAAAQFVAAEFGYPARAREHRRRLGREAVRAVFRRGIARSGRRRAGLQPALSDVCAQPRAPRCAGGARCRSRSSTSSGPQAEDVERFLATDPKPRAIFLNSPHNPTGGVATRDDLAAIADVVRGTDLMVFSDEPYCHMVWEGRHASILAEPGMLDHTRRGLHLQQVVQHERLADRLRRGSPRRCRGDRQADQHDGLVHSAARAAGAPRRPSSTTHRHATTTWTGSAARSSGSCAGLARIDGIRVVRPGRHVLRLPRRPAGLQPAGHHARTAWRFTCWKGPTTISASPAWAASASATPAAASSGLAVPSPMSASTRPWHFYPRR